MQNKKEEVEAALLAIQGKLKEAFGFLEKGEVELAYEIVRSFSALPFLTHGTKPAEVPEGSRIIEGVFDGEHMVGADGRQYLVPPNYASKSKLVEGDMMKLSITPQGAFIYKQIGPIERKRVVGTLAQDEHNFWQVTDGAQSWRVLTASVSYFKGKVGDEAVIFVPSATPSKWSAVENIISK